MRKEGSNKVAAGILSTVLAVSLIIATLCASLISLAYYYRIATVQHTVRDRLQDNAQSGINLLLATPDASTFAAGYWKDLFGKRQDSVWLQQKPWGIYRIGIATARRGRRSHQKIALLGHFPSELGRSALYLADEQRPLSIAGNTQLKGTCYLPKAGIKSAYINRVGYQGQQLVQGAIQESRRTLPQLSPNIVTYLRQTALPREYQWLTSLEDSLSHSFGQRPLYYHDPAPITLSGVLRGNIVIASDQAVRISAEAAIDNIIVTAPQVVIAPGFSGRLQALATDTLIVSPQCQLKYPSALVLQAPAGGTVLIDESSHVAGTVVVTGTATDYHRRLLSIAEESSVTGMVYVDGLVELKGSVFGHLSCRKFMLRTPSTLYENHILDGTIDPSQRSPHYLASSLWGASSQKGIAQWLY